MSSAADVMRCYPLLKQIMQHAFDGDTAAAAVAIGVVCGLLGEQPASCQTAIADLVAASDSGDLPAVWGQAWQLMAVLPYGFPPAGELCPPAPDGKRRLRRSFEHCGQDLPVGANFCPSCGTAVVTEIDTTR